MDQRILCACDIKRSAPIENQPFRITDSVMAFLFRPDQTALGFKQLQARDHGQGQHDEVGVRPPESNSELTHKHDPAQAAWFGSFLKYLSGVSP